MWEMTCAPNCGVVVKRKKIKATSFFNLFYFNGFGWRNLEETNLSLLFPLSSVNIKFISSFNWVH